MIINEAVKSGWEKKKKTILVKWTYQHCYPRRSHAVAWIQDKCPHWCLLGHKADARQTFREQYLERSKNRQINGWQWTLPRFTHSVLPLSISLTYLDPEKCMCVCPSVCTGLSQGLSPTNCWGTASGAVTLPHRVHAIATPSTAITASTTTHLVSRLELFTSVSWSRNSLLLLPIYLLLVPPLSCPPA